MEPNTTWNIIWFILIAVLFVGFFLLEGFDYGVGILLPFLGKTERDRRVILNAIGAHWNGNEVWLITAGGAIFAAFPNWYATMFSGFYIALVLVLSALIVRGVAIELRSKDESPRWRAFWDWSFFGSSLIAALLWGVAISNLVKGTPIDAKMNFVGNFLDLINVYTLSGGLLTLGAFTLYGAVYLGLKADPEIAERASTLAGPLGIVTIVVAVAWIVLGFLMTDMFTRLGFIPLITMALGAVALIASWLLNRARRQGWAFVTMAVTLLLTVATVFLGLFPRVMVSSLNPDWSLTIYNAASSAYTLSTMTIIAFVLVPIVLAYVAWSYWIFRGRVRKNHKLEY
jgi:cytochrome d ubiquinol oxidase subunit II